MKLLNCSQICNCLLPILIVLSLFSMSCSSSSDGSDGSGASSSSGIFVDSPVSGLDYKTDTQSGLTDANGRFLFQEGETVTFSIGGLDLGSGIARPVLTPVEIVTGAISANDLKVINLCRLLQSLDVDGDPSNGIEIPEAARELLLSSDAIDFDQSPADFGNDPQVLALLEDLNTMDVFPDIGGRQLVSAADALQHLQGTLAFLDLDNDGYSIFEGDCDDHDGNIYPGAHETPGDNIDSNCDGADNVSGIVTCGPGTISADNTCVPAGGTTCGPGLVEGPDGLCVPAEEFCEPGTKFDGNTGLCISVEGFCEFCQDNPDPNRNVCVWVGEDLVGCECNDFYEEDNGGNCVPSAPTGLQIYPDAAYAGYIWNSDLDWPDQYFRIQLFARAIFADNSVGYPYNGGLTWSSSDPLVATVDENGLLVTEDVEGDMSVTITVTSGDVSGTLIVNVLDTTLVQGVVISDNNYDLIHDGDYTISVEETERWRCLFLDERGTHLYNLSWDAWWLSSNEAVSVPDMDSFQGPFADVSRSAPGPSVITCGIERGSYYVETNTVAQ